MHPIILMVNGKTRYSKVSVLTTEMISHHVDLWKSEWGIKTLQIVSPGGMSTLSTARIVQSRFGEGSRVVPYLQDDPKALAQKAAKLSLSDPVIMVVKDSTQLHQIARALDVTVDQQKFENTQGVVIDAVRRTCTPFFAE